jgi:tetratricopeptide (TPR) repeat protein
MTKDNSPQSDRKYWAFISYSHSDTKETAWLHKALENYKIPSYLIGTETRTGVVPRRIFPVFRDRDELPTSSDLGGNLHAALRNSRYLVVVCSPRSAKSIWVDAEVNYFKKHHGGKNVLCLVVDGVPGGDEDSECFCPSLRVKIGPEGELTDEAVEPIAADMREGKDGRRRAFLKIAAGILGVDFDTLYQRDKKRRRNRLIALSSAALVGLAMLAVFYTRLEKVAKSQSDMASQVQKMQETKFREFGSLPKERAAQLGKIIADSGVLDAESLLNEAISVEKNRYEIYLKRAKVFTNERSNILSTIEDFLNKIEPANGWEDSLIIFAKLSTSHENSDAGYVEMMNNVYNAIKDEPPDYDGTLKLWRANMELSKNFIKNLDESKDLICKIDDCTRKLPENVEVDVPNSIEEWNPSGRRAFLLGNCAWFLATDPDANRRNPKKAIAFAKEAVEMDNKPHYVDTLAASLASDGLFDEAVKVLSDLLENRINDINPAFYDICQQRLSLYKEKKIFTSEISYQIDTNEMILCLANEHGLDSWCLRQRENLLRLESNLAAFPLSPEEKVVINAEIQKHNHIQKELEARAFGEIKKLSASYYDSFERTDLDVSADHYFPIENKKFNNFTVSLKIWRKPKNIPERGSMRKNVRTYIGGREGTINHTIIDREGSAELFCINSFLFVTEDLSSLDTESIIHARIFARKLGEFLGVYIPSS